MSHPKSSCPKCERPCESCGTVEDESGEYPVYQCDECMIDWEFDGSVFPAALTWAVRDGVAFDPAAPDGKLNLGK